MDGENQDSLVEKLQSKEWSNIIANSLLAVIQCNVDRSGKKCIVASTLKADEP